MLLLNNRTQIASYVFNFIHKVEVRSSWDMLTDTATLLLPKKLEYINELGVETSKITGSVDVINGKPEDYPVFVQGDKSSLSGGYGEDVPEVFSGYIRSVAPNYPIRIDFEDNMYWLKNVYPDNTLLKDVTLLELVQYITKDVPVSIKLNVPGTSKFFQEYRIDNKTAADVLQDLKKYNLMSWFRGDTLNVGFAYSTRDVNVVEKFRFYASGEHVNIIDTDSLEWKSEEQVKVKINITSTFTDNSKINYNYGDENGVERRMKVEGVTQSGIEQIAKEGFDNKVYNGYVGHFTTFLLPLVKHGDAVKLSDPRFPEREGTYLVKEVVYRYGVDGGRQQIKLDAKIG